MTQGTTIFSDAFSCRNRGGGGPPGRRTGYRCLVENLSSRTSWQDLKDYMRKVTVIG